MFIIADRGILNFKNSKTCDYYRSLTNQTKFAKKISLDLLNIVWAVAKRLIPHPKKK